MEPTRSRWPRRFVWLAVLVSFSTSAETLRDAIDRAIRTNPEVLAAGDRRRAADESVKEARAGYWPRVDLDARYGRDRLNDLNTRVLGLSNTTFEHRDAALTLSQMLFDGFAVSSDVARQRARVDSTAHSTAATAEDIAVRTVDAYLDVLRRQDTVVAAAENLEAHERIHSQIRLRSESGVGRRADFDQAEARLALAQANLRTEESGLRDAEITYLRVVGTAPRAQVKPAVQEGELPASTNEALQVANARNPAVKAAEADVAVATAQVGVARAALAPRLELVVGATHANDIVARRRDDVTVLLQLHYNLFRGGADQARINQTSYQLDEASELLNRTRREVDERVSLSFNTYRTSRDRLGMLQRYADASAATREAYAKQFSIGQRTLLDLLNAENEYFNARLSYVTGQYLVLAAHFHALASMGTLLDTLQIPPPAESVTRDVTMR